MKKIIYILLAIIMAACTHEDIATIQSTEGTPVTLTFKVQVPEMGVASRTFGETATIKNLTLYVFDESGYYLYPAKAELLNNVTDHENVPADSQTEKTFKVTLSQSSSKRIIHFVANYTPSETLTFDAEQVLITKMSVGGTDDAYWQRVVFEGIDEDTEMKKIPLVRNFAKVTVYVTADNFTLTDYAVVNMPTKGTVAAYNTSNGSFASYTDASVYNDLARQNYQGSIPNDVLLKGTGTANDPYQFSGNSSTPVYMYERKQPKDDTYTYLLVHGTYQPATGDGVECYYKIDLIDTGYVPYNILRNFEYKVTIKEVVSPGKQNAADAASGSANNIISTTTTSNLLNISDGYSRLYVSFTDTTLVNTDPVKLKYKYIPDVSTGTSSNSDVIVGTITAAGILNTSTLKGSVVDGYSIAADTDDNTWHTITITPNNPSAEAQHQTIRIQAGALVREVNLHLVNQLEMGLSCNPIEVDYGINKPVDVIMTLPADIPEMYFPLVFKIEAESLSIYPDSDSDYMPLEVGPSIVPSKNKAQSYYFTKTLEYKDYKNADGTFNRNLVSHFLTNKEASGSKIYVYNEYFKFPLSTSFTNPRAFKNSALDNDDRYGEGQEVLINFNMNSLDPVTITVTEGTNTSTITYTPTKMGYQTVTYETKTWNSQISVKLEAEGYESVSVTGATRNKLLIKISTINNVDSNTYVSAYRNTYYNNALATKTASEWTSEWIELEYSNISDPDNVTIYFRSGNYGSRKYASATISQLIAGDLTLNMN